LRVAKSKSGEFYTFDEVLRQLSIDENRLKRLVSEGEIRAFREGDQMRFKRSEIDALAGRSGRGSRTSDTSLTEISLEDESQPTVNVGGTRDTLSDDLLIEEEPGGMRTAEISSQDTYIDRGDVGMSTEPIDFTEDEAGEDAAAIEDIGVDRSRRGAAQPQQARRRPAPALEEAHTPLWIVLLLALGLVTSVAAALVSQSVVKGHSNKLTSWFAQNIGGVK
jgi:excisionase family DNA binding protein